MKFIVEHGNIASIMHVTVVGENKEFDLIMLNDVRSAIQPNLGSRLKWSDIPLSLQAVAVNQFTAVFKLPYHERQAWIDKQIPIEVEVA